LLGEVSGKPMNADSQFKLNLGFTCPAAIVARTRRAAGVKAWRYRYFGNWPNQEFAPGVGAYHGSEIAMIFGTSEVLSKTPDVPSEAQLSRIMRTAWATFAKDPENGLSDIGWPVYEQHADTLIRLGFQNEPRASLGSNEEYDRFCKIWEQEPSISAPTIKDEDDEFTPGSNGAPPTFSVITPTKPGKRSRLH
jgi:carboxylesterase type B